MCIHTAVCLVYVYIILVNTLTSCLYTTGYMKLPRIYTCKLIIGWVRLRLHTRVNKASRFLCAQIAIPSV